MEATNVIICHATGGSSSFQARIVCPWCGVLTTTQPKTHTQRPGSWAFFVDCGDNDCGRSALVVAPVPGVRSGTFPAAVYPQAQAKYSPVGVPDSIAREFREARNCEASGYLLGAALVGRRVLQAAARNEVGSGLPNLNAEIAALPANKVPGTLVDAAHQVRLIGNEAAHAEEVTADDVNDLLDYTEEILHALFVMPARVAATKARRQ